MVVLDDVGFSQLGSFGSDVETPHFDRLAQGGLRYNRFHVTAMCSPTRAALLTGRNHHAVGMGFLSDVALRYPGYTGRIPKSAGTVAHALRGAGYSTLAAGKWHLAPRGDRTASGPFDLWPLGQGFERYYGFLRASTNQWTPDLVADNHFVSTPRRPEDGYHLTEDLVDNAIRQLLDQQHATPGKPFFLYLATGAMHAPHHVPHEWVDRYSGQFDQGWERWRAEAFDRQVASGVVPEGTNCTPRPMWVQDWDELSADERRLYARTQEVFAGFMSHTDHHVGRLLTFLGDQGLLDNTIVLVLSDNGASAEGGPLATMNEFRTIAGTGIENLGDNVAHRDEWGGFRLYNHYAWGWAWAGNTPFHLWKRYTWLGGTRVPLIVHWPAGVTAQGEVRSQFCHAVDIMPTVLDVCGVDAPDTVNGVAQQPIDGASLLATFGDRNAAEPRDKQYFELLGSRSIYYRGWKATTNRVQKALDDEERLFEGSRSLADDQWQLFRLDEDFAEANDLARENPETLARLEQLWWAEAGRNQVLPMGDWMERGGNDSRHAVQPRPYQHSGRRVFAPGGNPIDNDVVPSLSGGGRLTVDVDVPADRPEGVLCAQGNWTGGWALYVRDGRLAYVLNSLGTVHRIVADEPIAVGAHKLAFELGLAKDGTGVGALYEGERRVGFGRFPRAAMSGSWYMHSTGLRLGYDDGFPVSDDYECPFAWTGVLHQVTFEALPVDHTLAAQVLQALHQD